MSKFISHRTNSSVSSPVVQTRENIDAHYLASQRGFGEGLPVSICSRCPLRTQNLGPRGGRQAPPDGGSSGLTLIEVGLEGVVESKVS